jgi:hypothetical protein
MSATRLNIHKLTKHFLFCRTLSFQGTRQKNSPKATDSPIKSPLRTRNGSIDEDEGVSEELVLRRESPVNQCISELSLKRNSLKKLQSPTSPTTTSPSANQPPTTTDPEPQPEDTNSTAAKRRSSHNEQSLLSSPSHFVTVIEVKEPQSGTDENKNSVPRPRKPPNSYENVLINTNAAGSAAHSENSNLVQNCDQNNSFKQQAKPAAPSISERTTLLFSHSQQQQDLKKKVPPR